MKNLSIISLFVFLLGFVGGLFVELYVAEIGIFIIFASWLIVSILGVVSYFTKQDIYCYKTEVKSDDKEWKRDAALFGHISFILLILFFFISNIYS